MRLEEIDDPERLKRINAALMNRVESVLDQQGNAFSMFQTALSLEGQVKRRTDELTNAMHRLEKINSELALAKEAAEQANQSKTSFLAAASHDVLQPLNAALLSVSVLRDLQTSQQGSELVRQVERSLETMSELLGTLLDISRLDAGVMQPTIETISLDKVFDSLESDFGPIGKSKGLKLRFRPGSLSVASDNTMLRRILQNLVSNALRYTSDGGVLVGVRRRGELACIEIHDTGQGIAENLRADIFEEFHRGDVPVGRTESSGAGLGLGLSIVKRMAAALNHRLQLNSKVGRGTIFRLYVPMRDPEPTRTQLGETATRGRTRTDLHGTQVLLLENDADVADAMTRLLAAWGCESFLARNSPGALEMLGDWQPDLIIADQHLDDGDLGITTLQAIRRQLNNSIPAVIVTAKPGEALESEARNLGVELMAKPVKPAHLRALVTHILAQKSA
ncbi:MAG: ATP-binding response regulator [Rhizobiaceae bacterium]